jgi:uncharacterized repeat protein (TIGR01451 family)
MKKLSPLLLCMAFSVYLQAAESPVNLGSTVNFAGLASSTLTNTGPTIVNGDIGVYAGSAITGFPPGTVVGGVTHIHAADGTAATAQGDLTTAYLDAALRPTPIVLAVSDLGGQVLPAGLYKTGAIDSLGITGTVTLTGAANSVFIFQIASTLTTATSSQVVLTGGVTAANIFWQVGSSATLGTYSNFSGTIMAQASVSALTGALLNGRALARTGAVTLDTNSVVNPGPPVTGSTPPALSGLTCPVNVASVNVAYNSYAVPVGGTSPYAFSISSGSLPPGSPAFSLNPSTGDLTGTPTGTTTTYTFGVNVTDSASGSASASCQITVTAVADQADVRITKTGPTPSTVAPNTNVTYTIVVTNTGQASAAGVTVTDILPAGTTFVSATSPCTSSLGTVTCNLGTMPSSGSGSSVTIQLVIKSPSASGPFDNLATVVSTTTDPNTTNNRSTATVTVNANIIPAVPTLSTWGLALLALLLLLAGCAARFGRKARA